MIFSPARLALPALCGILVGLLTTISVFLLPRPLPADADPTVFSADRAMNVLRLVAAEPHSIAEPAAHARARDRVVAQFEALGLTPEVRSDPVTPDVLAGRNLPAAAEAVAGSDVPAAVRDHRLQNILVRIPGRTDRTMLLMSHYDSAFNDAVYPNELAPGTSSGAADAGYGVATIVETVRALQAEGRRPENSLLILISDAEEAGMLGVTSELLRHPDDYADVEWVVNLEARGTSGPALLFETSPRNAALVGHHLQAAPGSVTTSLMPAVYRSMPNNTDLTPFLNRGFTGINIAAVGGGEHYHWATDDIAHAEPSTLQHYGDQVLATTRDWMYDPDAPALADSGPASPAPTVPAVTAVAPDAPTAGSDAHFFTLWRGFTVRYPEPIGLAAAAVALLSVAGALVRRRRLRWASMTGIVWGLTWRTLAVTVTAGAVQVGLAAIGLMPPMRAPFGPNPLLVWVFGVGLLALVLLLGRFLARQHRVDGGGRRAMRDEAWAAVLLLQACGVLVTVVLAPGASYLVTWPAVLLAAAWLSRGPSRCPASAEPALTGPVPTEPVSTGLALTGASSSAGAGPAGSGRRRATAVLAASAAFVVTALFGPMIVLLHQAMSVSLVTVSLLFAALPLAPLMLLAGLGERPTPARDGAAAAPRRRRVPATT